MLCYTTQSQQWHTITEVRGQGGAFGWGCPSELHIYMYWYMPRSKRIIQSVILIIPSSLLYSVIRNAELVNTEPLLFRGNTGLGSWEPLVTVFSSVNQYVTLFQDTVFSTTHGGYFKIINKKHTDAKTWH